jgi:autotransporter-associated beta strand protein
MSRHLRPFVVVLLTAGLVPAAATAQSGSWNANTAGSYNWSLAGNWLNDSIADGANNTATFATAGLTGDITVNLDSVRTIGALVFDNPTNTFGWTITGSNSLTLSNSASGGPTIEVNNGAITATIASPLAGTQGFTKTGSGTLNLTGTNSYSGTVTVSDGTLAVTGDANLGTAAVTLSALATLAYSTTATTSRTFNLSGGTLAANSGATVTLNGNTVSGGFLAGPGTFSTDPTNGARFAGATAQSNATISSNSGADRFTNFTNNGTVNIAASNTAASPVTLSGFSNEGGGSLTIGPNTYVNATNFQSYGTVNILAGTGGGVTQLTNAGTSPLGFNGGSRTQIGDPRQAPLLNAGIDLHGHDLDVAGGLFVNDGFIIDSSGTGTAQMVVAGSLVKGSGAPLMTTSNGGKFQAGDPIGLSHGPTVFGPNGMTNFVFDIDDATGTAGPAPDAAGHVSGWSTITEDSRGFTWAGAWNMHLQTLLNPATVGTNGMEGPMDQFDPSKPYSWTFAQWAGTYNGPTDPATLAAQTGFDTSGFANPIAGTFGWQLDVAGKTLSLTYTPTPEPGSLALVAAAAGGFLGRRRFMRLF